MVTAPFEKKATDLERKPPEVGKKKASERVRKLTFGQKMVLAAGMITLGGIPPALMAAGSVQKPHAQESRTAHAEIMSNTTPPEFGVCMIPEPGNEFKPTMNLRNR